MAKVKPIKSDQSDINGEMWKPVPGFEYYYLCSDFGRIKSIDRIVVYRNGKTKKMYGRILKPGNDKDGYLKVTFSINGVHKHFRVNRVVALTFIGVSELGTNHKDGNKKNNKLSNLEYGTQKENVHHYLKNGLKKIFKGGGKPPVQIKLINVYTQEEVIYKSTQECAKVFNTDPTVLYHHLNKTESFFRKKYIVKYA